MRPGGDQGVGLQSGGALWLPLSWMGFPRGSVIKKKNPPSSAGRCRRCRFDPWVGKILWRRKRQPTQVFLIGESMDREARWATVYRVPKSWTWLSEHKHSLMDGSSPWSFSFFLSCLAHSGQGPADPCQHHTISVWSITRRPSLLASSSHPHPTARASTGPMKAFSHSNSRPWTD